LLLWIEVLPVDGALSLLSGHTGADDRRGLAGRDPGHPNWRGLPETLIAPVLSGIGIAPKRPTAGALEIRDPRSGPRPLSATSFHRHRAGWFLFARAGSFPEHPLPIPFAPLRNAVHSWQRDEGASPPA
jgi:hypothetical protein